MPSQASQDKSRKLPLHIADFISESFIHCIVQGDGFHRKVCQYMSSSLHRNIYFLKSETGDQVENILR